MIQNDTIPFLHRTTWLFCIDIVLMVVVSLTDPAGYRTGKSIIVDQTDVSRNTLFYRWIGRDFRYFGCIVYRILVKQMLKYLMAGLLLYVNIGRCATV